MTAKLTQTAKTFRKERALRKGTAQHRKGICLPEVSEDEAAPKRKPTKKRKASKWKRNRK